MTDVENISVIIAKDIEKPLSYRIGGNHEEKRFCHRRLIILAGAASAGGWYYYKENYRGFCSGFW